MSVNTKQYALQYEMPILSTLAYNPPFIDQVTVKLTSIRPITVISLTNKRRAVAAQTARSRCKFRYALFREYRHPGQVVYLSRSQ